MKLQYFIFLLSCLFAGSTINAQIINSNVQQPLSINVDGAAADSSAIFDASSDSLGVLIPRMSSTDRLAINNPAEGLLVYDTTLSTVCHFTGASWTCILPPGCQTLDDAYDCGGPGFGATIFVDTFPVTLLGGASTSSTLVVSSGAMVAATSVDQFGTGEVISAHHFNPISSASALSVVHDGLGRAGEFVTTNPMTMARTLEAINMGPGIAGYFETLFPLDTNRTLEAHSFGLGVTGYFETHNPMDTAETVLALNNGDGDGVHGIATDTVFDVAGVKGTGQGDAMSAAAIEAHDGAIRVSRTMSPNTPAERFDTVLVSWLPMDDCPSFCGGSGTGGDTHAWNSDFITISNVYVDPARSVIMHSVECPVPNIGIKAITKFLAPGSFVVQFVVDVDQCPSGIGCVPPSGLPVSLHYLIVNR